MALLQALLALGQSLVLADSHICAIVLAMKLVVEVGGSSLHGLEKLEFRRSKRVVCHGSVGPASAATWRFSFQLRDSSGLLSC